MIIKKVDQAQEVPFLFALYYFCHQTRRAHCAPIGLNILLYFILEMQWSIIKMMSECSRHYMEDGDLEVYLIESDNANKKD